MRLCGTRAIWGRNLSYAEEREAKQSILVDAETMNEIEQCRKRIDELNKKIAQIELEIAGINKKE